MLDAEDAKVNEESIEVAGLSTHGAEQEHTVSSEQRPPYVLSLLGRQRLHEFRVGKQLHVAHRRHLTISLLPSNSSIRSYMWSHVQKGQ